MMVFMFAAVAFAAPNPELQNPDNNTTDPYVDNNVEDLDGITAEPTTKNANQTGKGADAAPPVTGEKAEVIKNVDGHKTHGEYQNNTNSCASCHQTHTSKGKQLLFADTTYQTCAACHDGTLGFYNVFEVSKDSMDGAGTFGGSHANNMSIHQSNDAVKIKAAPGGYQAATSTSGGQWTGNFNCASCHAPHGSYSDRLLHYNPNGMATTPANIQTTGENFGGKQLTFASILDAVPASPASNAAPYIMAKSKVTIDGTDHTKVAVYKLEEIKPSTTPKTYQYVLSTTPMLYGYSSHGTPHFTHLSYNDNGEAKRIEYKAHSEHPDVYFNNEEGYFIAETAKGEEILNGGTGITELKGQVSLAYTVQMDLQVVQDIDGLKIYKNNQSAYWTEKDLAGNAFAGQGIKMSEYCAACHTDYLAGSSTRTGIKSGTYAKSFRHTTNNASYTCVRCHFAHGTDAEIMMDGQGQTVAELTATGGKFEGKEAEALSYMKDANPSSALKKFTNMTVCWACHNSSKATTIKNTNRPEDHPNGMPFTDVNFGGTVKSIQR